MRKTSRASRQIDSPAKSKRKATGKDADTAAVEKTLAEALGLKVKIVHQGRKGGEIRIRYKTLEQLDDVCRRLNRKPGK